MIADSPQPVRLRVFADSLNTLNRQPQGAPQVDSQVYPDNCGPGFPFRFRVELASNILRVNSAKLSFFLEAFRGYEATSGGGSALTAGTKSR